MARKTVQLRIYKGKEVLLKQDGSPANENQKLTLTYDDTQWKNHLNNLKKTGICKIKIEGYFVGEKEEKIPEELQKEIDSLLKTEQVELTPEQKTIKMLTERLEKLEGKNDGSDLEVKGAKVITGLEEGETLEQLQARYVEKFEKELPKPFKNNVAWIKTQLES